MSLREFTVFVASLMAIVALTIDALLPAFGAIASELRVSDANQVQLVVAAVFVGLSMGQLISGPLSDSFGRKPILLAALIIYFIGTLICFFANSIELLWFGRWIQGLGAAGPNVAAISLVRDRYKGREMARIMSLVMMIFMMVPALAPMLGQGLLFISDWRSIFILYFVYGLVSFAWVYFRLKESLPEEKRIPFRTSKIVAGFKEVLKNKRTTSLMISMGCVYGCLIAYISSCQQIIQEQLGAGKMFSVYFGLLALLIGASALINSRLVERMGMHFLATLGLRNIIVSSAIFLTIQLFVDVKLWMFLLYASTLFGSLGFISSNLNAMAIEPMGHLAGIASAVIGASASLVSITAGVVIGQAYDGTVLPITLGSLVLASLAWVLVTLSHRQAEVNSVGDSQKNKGHAAKLDV